MKNKQTLNYIELIHIAIVIFHTLSCAGFKYNNCKFPTADRKPAGGFIKLTTRATFWDNKEKYVSYCKVHKEKTTPLLLPD